VAHRKDRPCADFDQPRRTGPAARLAQTTRDRGFATARSPRPRSCRRASPRRCAKYLEWYAGYQFPDGRVPCCVEPAAAPDPAPEHDKRGRVRVRGGRVLSLHRATPATLAPAVAPTSWVPSTRSNNLRRKRRTGRLPRRPGAALLRSPSRVDQPRGLRGAAGSLLLGRTSLPARSRERGGSGGRGRRRGKPSPRFAAMRDEFRSDLRRSIAE